MLRLLLKEESKKIKREYVYRFLILLFAGLSSILILFLISLLPAYFLLKIDKKVLSEEVKISQNSELNSDRKQLKEKLNALRETLNTLDTNQYQISYFIQKITEKQPRTVNISTISFDSKGSGSINRSNINIQGNANSRESLADFAKSLEDVDGFESVVLPFSSFAKDTEIPFSITIILKSLEDEK